MTRYVSAELLKLRTLRSTWVALVLIGVGAGALVVASAELAGTGENPPLSPAALADAIRAPARVAGGAVLVLGILAAAGEHRHRTVVSTFLAVPRRSRVFVAKLLAITVLGLVAGVVVDAVVLATSAVVLPAHGVAIDVVRTDVVLGLVVVPLVLVLHALIGVALGWLLASPAAAIGTAFSWAFVVEGVLPVVTREPDLVRWLSTGLVNALLGAGRADPAAVAPALAAALLATYAAALAAVAAATAARREH